MYTREDLLWMMLCAFIVGFTAASIYFITAKKPK